MAAGKASPARTGRAECSSLGRFSPPPVEQLSGGRLALPRQVENFYSTTALPPQSVFLGSVGSVSEEWSFGALLLVVKRNYMNSSPTLCRVRCHARWFGNRWLSLIAVAGLTTAPGCTSVISSAYLRDAWLDVVEHAVEKEPEQAAGEKGNEKDRRSAKGIAKRDVGDDEAQSAAESIAVDPQPLILLDEAVEKAESQLADAGGLTEAARSMLIATLKSTPRQDWPIVVEEFAAALAVAQTASGLEQSAATTEPSPTLSPSATTSAAVAEPVAPLPPTAAAIEEPPPHAIVTAEPVPPAFSIQNACFASRVRAWGVVERFDASRFQPGQEVIVYFELDQLSAREHVDGHTTRIDTSLRLVGADGRRIHEWTFEPLEETSEGRRHDYFARYLVTLPETLPEGQCQLEVAVSDAIAGRTSHASLPLEVAGR